MQKIIVTGGAGSILKRNTPQLAAAGIKGIRIQLRLGSALPGSIFMRRRLGCPAACCAWVRRRRFTSSAVIRHLINQSDYTVINLDKLTYAGNLDSLKEVDNSPRYLFELADICDPLGVQRVFEEYRDGSYRRERLEVNA